MGQGLHSRSLLHVRGERPTRGSNPDNTRQFPQKPTRAFTNPHRADTANQTLYSKKRWNFRKADWERFGETLDRSVNVIPTRLITIQEAYDRFQRALFCAARKAFPEGLDQSIPHACT